MMLPPVLEPARTYVEVLEKCTYKMASILSDPYKGARAELLVEK